MNKKVIYTCIVGNYDDLLEPIVVSDGFDYVCFTDQLFKSSVWKIRPIPSELNELSQVKKQRCIKINPHIFLDEYDFSMWVDGNIQIVGDVNDYVEKHIKSEDCTIFIPKHPQRNCIYEEAEACIKLHKDTQENVYRQINRYHEEGFPKNYGLTQSGIIFRYHNDDRCKKIMDEWWNEVKNGSHRDQLSLFYVLWKNSDIKLEELESTLFKSKWFLIGYKHKKDRKQTIRVTKKSNRKKEDKKTCTGTKIINKPKPEINKVSVVKKVQARRPRTREDIVRNRKRP